MPRFFLHHQIDLAQRDGKKLLLSMINAVSRILCLDFDFPENYTHINQVFCTHLRFMFTTSVARELSIHFLSLHTSDNEPDGLVP